MLGFRPFFRGTTVDTQIIHLGSPPNKDIGMLNHSLTGRIDR